MNQFCMRLRVQITEGAIVLYCYGTFFRLAFGTSSSDIPESESESGSFSPAILLEDCNATTYNNNKSRMHCTALGLHALIVETMGAEGAIALAPPSPYIKMLPTLSCI